MKLIIVPNGKTGKKNQQFFFFYCDSGVCRAIIGRVFGNFATSPVSLRVASASTNNSIFCPEEMEKQRAIRQTNHADPIPIFPNM